MFAISLARRTLPTENIVNESYESLEDIKLA
jgi:hypothetical protein